MGTLGGIIVAQLASFAASYAITKVGGVLGGGAIARGVGNALKKKFGGSGKQSAAEATLAKIAADKLIPDEAMSALPQEHQDAINHASRKAAAGTTGRG